MAAEKRVLNKLGTHVWMANPENGIPWECPVDVADVFAGARGWVFVDAPDTSLDGLYDPVEGDVQEEQDEQTHFNPDDHTVDEVNDYLDEHADVLGEVERVLEAERAGKNRTTITGD